jgi:large subunit ribosomal protein L10
MNREQKAEFVQDLHGRLSVAPFVILTGYKGSTVAQMDSLRRACEPAGVYFRVVKNTLAVRALEGTGMEGLADHFKGPIGVVIAGEDAVGAAKTFNQLAKENDKLQVKAGFFDGEILDAKATTAVADMPSKEQLQAQLLAGILAAPRKVLSMLQAAPRDLLYLLRNYETKLEEQG